MGILVRILVLCLFAGLISVAIGCVCDVQPFPECKYQNDEQQWVVVWGYYNKRETNCELVPGGYENKFTPSPKIRGQPSTYLPGIHHNVLSTIVTGPKIYLKWHLSKYHTIGVKALELSTCAPTTNCPPPITTTAGTGPTEPTEPTDHTEPTDQTEPTGETEPSDQTRTTETQGTEPPETTEQPPTFRPTCEPYCVDDVDVDISSYCTIERIVHEGEEEYYLFSLSNIVPDNFTSLITLGEYNGQIRHRGSCDSMLSSSQSWVDVWFPRRIENGWQFVEETDSRMVMKNHFSIQQLDGCTDADAQPILTFCTTDGINGHCIGQWYATILKAADIDDEQAGEDILYSVPCSFHIDEKLGGIVSTNFFSNLMHVFVSMIKTHCVDGNIEFTIETCAAPYTPERTIRLIFSSLSSNTEGIEFTLISYDQNCHLRGNRCCQRWTIRANHAPPLIAQCDIGWHPEVAGEVSDEVEMITHVNLEIDNDCAGMDVAINFTGEASVAIYTDDELTQLYDPGVSPPILDGTRAYGKITLDVGCDDMHKLVVDEVRICWSRNDVQLVPLDPLNPETTGCRTTGAVVEEVILYNTILGPNADYNVELVYEPPYCTLVVSWIALMAACPGTVNILEADWRAMKRAPMLFGRDDIQWDENSYIYHTTQVQDAHYYMDCNSSSMVFDPHSHGCVYTNGFFFVGHWLFWIGILVLLLLVSMCFIGCCLSWCTPYEHHHEHHHHEKPAPESTVRFFFKVDDLKEHNI